MIKYAKKEDEKKLMIVVWKWRHTNNNTLPLPEGADIDHIPVSSHKHYWLVRYDPEDIDASIDIIRDTIKEERYAGYKVILFLHLNHYYEQQHIDKINNLDAGCKPDKCILFGHRDHLYIHEANSPLGLLASNGKMEGNFSGNVICATEENSEKHYVKKKHFDSVWNFYYNSMKLEAYTLKEDFTRIYWPLSLSKTELDSTSVQSMNGRLIIYAEKINNISGNQLTFPLRKESEESSQTNFYDKDILQLFQELSNAIHDFTQKEPTLQIKKIALTSLRNAFHDLLNALPENTYA